MFSNNYEKASQSDSPISFVHFKMNSFEKKMKSEETLKTREYNLKKKLYMPFFTTEKIFN